jgi:excinuclease ABC subunit B
VSLVAVLDADKEGFLRSTTSLIQTMGRAARHVNGTVILYADAVTRSMNEAIDETRRRRLIQAEYNAEHHITPESIIKPVDDELARICNSDYVDLTRDADTLAEFSDVEALEGEIARLEEKMLAAAEKYEFEQAAVYRDRIKELQQMRLEYEDGQDLAKRR